MGSAKIKVGVIGTGYWGLKIVEEFSRIDGVTILGISDVDESRLQHCAMRFGIRNHYRDYRALLSDQDLDAVAVCAPNSLHYQIARDAVDAGKHVLVEKPMTLNAREGRELVDLARANGLLIAVGHVFRFNNALGEIRRLIRHEHYFGRIYLIEIEWTNRHRPFEDRDILWDQAPHMFDIQNYLLDQWPVEVTCTAGAFRRQAGEEAAYVACKFQEGTLAMCSINWLALPKTRRVVVAGEKCTASVDVLNQTITIYEEESARAIRTDANNTIQEELVHFIESIQNPSRPARNSASVVGVRTVELIEAAKKSWTERRAVRLEEFAAR